jgi:AcrR family transcriptional regulator
MVFCFYKHHTSEIMNDTQNLSMKFVLLNCAIDLFKQYGYKQVTINQICKAAGISKTTFYYHYSSKESLISDFYSQVNLYAKENLASILSADNYVEQLWSICEMYMKPFEDVGSAIVKELLYINFGSDSLAIAPEDIYLKEVMISTIQRAKEDGQIQNPATAEELFDTLVYILDGVSFIWATKDGKYDLAAKSREAFEIHLMLRN